MQPASPAHTDDSGSFPEKVGHPFLRGKQNQFHDSVLKKVGRHQLHLIAYIPRYYVHKPSPLFICQLPTCFGPRSVIVEIVFSSLSREGLNK